MLHVLNAVPEGLLEHEAAELYKRLPGPTLIHLAGRRPEPLFVSVLLHGNETSGWLAMRTLLGKYANVELPRAMSLLIGNIAAARVNERLLPGQLDHNRIWEGGRDVQDRPEYQMVCQVVEEMRARGVFASVDIHNTTGINPHYANVRCLDARTLQLAALFGRTVVYFKKPAGVQVAAFSRLCPAVTVECGQSAQPAGVQHALEYVEACLHLAEIPDHRVPAQDVDLFHSAAIVKVPPALNFGFHDDNLDIRFIDDLDHLNFRELPAGTTLGWVRDGSGARLEVHDELGCDVSDRFFGLYNGEIRTQTPFIPALLTLSVDAIRQDCLCYVMERYADFYNGTL
jgi:succinylglutamate desuccinylase